MKLFKNIIVIILLVCIFPLGLIAMWLFTSWSKGFKWFITLFIPGLIILSVSVSLYFGILRSNRISERINVSSTTYEYTDPTYLFSFHYPASWYVGNSKTGINYTLDIKGKERIYGINVVNKLAANATDIKSLPDCAFNIDVFNNPNNHELEDWHSSNYSIPTDRPLTVDEQSTLELMKRHSFIQINGTRALKDFTGNNFFISYKDVIIRLNNSRSEYECREGYDIVFNSFTLNLQ